MGEKEAGFGDKRQIVEPVDQSREILVAGALDFSILGEG